MLLFAQSTATSTVSHFTQEYFLFHDEILKYVNLGTYIMISICNSVVDHIEPIQVDGLLLLYQP